MVVELGFSCWVVVVGVYRWASVVGMGALISSKTLFTLGNRCGLTRAWHPPALSHGSFASLMNGPA